MTEVPSPIDRSTQSLKEKLEQVSSDEALLFFTNIILLEKERSHEANMLNELVSNLAMNIINHDEKVVHPVGTGDEALQYFHLAVPYNENWDFFVGLDTDSESDTVESLTDVKKIDFFHYPNDEDDTDAIFDDGEFDQISGIATQAIIRFSYNPRYKTWERIPYPGIELTDRQVREYLEAVSNKLFPSEQ